jgi:hypothetical protein
VPAGVELGAAAGADSAAGVDSDGGSAGGFSAGFSTGAAAASASVGGTAAVSSGFGSLMIDSLHAHAPGGTFAPGVFDTRRRRVSPQMNTDEHR